MKLELLEQAVEALAVSVRELEEQLVALARQVDWHINSDVAAQDATTGTIVVYDDTFAENNAHERELRAKRTVGRIRKDRS